jgi:hypothetical protein
MSRFANISNFNNQLILELDDVYNAVEKAGAWEWLKNTNEKFMTCTHPMMNKIYELLEYKGHSGATFAYVLRHMESIAKDGWDGYLLKVC